MPLSAVNPSDNKLVVETHAQDALYARETMATICDYLPANVTSSTIPSSARQPATSW